MIAAFSPCRVNEYDLVTGRVARCLQRGYLVGDIVAVVYEIHQAEVVERYEVFFRSGKCGALPGVRRAA